MSESQEFFSFKNENVTIVCNNCEYSYHIPSCQFSVKPIQIKIYFTGLFFPECNDSPLVWQLTVYHICIYDKQYVKMNLSGQTDCTDDQTHKKTRVNTQTI